jgi:hypothetical protein
VAWGLLDWSFVFNTKFWIFWYVIDWFYIFYYMFVLILWMPKWQQRGCSFSIDRELVVFFWVACYVLRDEKVGFWSSDCLSMPFALSWQFLGLKINVFFSFVYVLVFFFSQIYSLLIIWSMGIREACFRSLKWPFWVCFSFLGFLVC